MSEECKPDATPGRFGWNELNTSDVEGAKKFYSEVFGWESQTEKMGPGMEYTTFKQGNHMVGGLVSHPGCEAPPHWAAYINSDDIPTDVAKAKAAGATILIESMDIPNAVILAVIKDPQGAVFQLWKCAVNAS